MGVGKTTMGKRLATAIGYQFIDLDDIIEQEIGLSIPTIFEKQGEDYFRKLERDFLVKTSSFTQTVIACGGGTPCHFNNIQWMNENGICIWLKAPLYYIIDRLSKSKRERPLIKDFNKSALTQFVEQHYLQRVPFYKKAKFSFDVTSKKLEELIIFVKFHFPNDA